MSKHDLHVDGVSRSLQGLNIDCVISGSIGSIESPRLIRALRRLGATVTPYLTQGGQQFVTPMTLSWAAANACNDSFSGTSSHIAEGDGCLVAPASANFLGKIANGETSCPSSALVASYLGQKKPVIVLPNMHDSLWNAPAVQANIVKVSAWVTMLQPRLEEGKVKFPDPNMVANQVSHHLNKIRRQVEPIVLVTMGSMRGYIDDIRYISNYSSGGLGTEISLEAYRQGMETWVVCGPCEIKPPNYSKFLAIETYPQMLAACQEAVSKGVNHLVMAASVLDFVPLNQSPGKIPSDENLSVSFKRTEKIIGQLHPLEKKVGFKLESDATHNDKKADAIARSYCEKYGLSLMVVNQFSNINNVGHKARLYRNLSRHFEFAGVCSTKREIAYQIVQHLMDNSQISS